MNTFMQKLGVLAAMLSTFLSVSAFKVGELYYNITDPIAKEVEIATCSDSHIYSIVIPSSVSYNGVEYSVTSIRNYAFASFSNLTSITLPNSVTSIGVCAFAACSALTSITIPNSVTSIEACAFIQCSSLAKVVFPNSLATIGGMAFAECFRMTAITLPNSVTTIGEAAFSECYCLTSITIPNSVTSIGIYAFGKCFRLTSIDVDADNQTYSSNDGILYDKSQTRLICCPGGKYGEVIIPNSVTTIGDRAFDGCSSLTSITIPNSVTSIGRGAFSDCSSLTSITLPNSVTSVGYYVFSNCTNLTSITSLAVTPPACKKEAFEAIDKQNCTLYVPAGSVEAYKLAPEWKDFLLVEAVEAGIDPVVAGSADGATEVFNLKGAKVAASLENLPAGIYLVREGSTVRKITVR